MNIVFNMKYIKPAPQKSSIPKPTVLKLKQHPVSTKTYGSMIDRVHKSSGGCGSCGR